MISLPTRTTYQLSLLAGVIVSCATLSGCSSYYYWKYCVITSHARIFGCIPPPTSQKQILLLEQVPPAPQANPQSEAKARLGEKLFGEVRLSKTGEISCKSCHQPESGFANNTPFSVGINRQAGSRNAPGLLNVAYQRHFFFDGRVGSLEQQAREPIFNRLELGRVEVTPLSQQGVIVEDDIEAIVRMLKEDSHYPAAFDAAFAPFDINKADSREIFTKMLEAIASYQRTLTSTESPFDQWVVDKAPISRAAQRGWRLFFGKARCAMCHVPPTYSDDNFHNIGVRPTSEAPGDKGRASFLDQHPQSQAPGVKQPLQPPTYEIEGLNYWGKYGMDACAFKTPSLRNVEHTRPYMHTGAFNTLEEVISFYVRGGDSAPCGQKDWRIQKLDLSEQEQKDLVEFLRSLSGTKVPPGVPKTEIDP